MAQQLLPAVAAAIFNQKGEVLLQKRKDVNRWCIPSGHVEFGETVEQAILREIKQETAAEGEVVRLIGIYSSPDSQTYRYPNKTVQYITTYFEIKLDQEITPGFCNDETLDLRYFPIHALPAELAQLNQHWLSDALDNKVFIR